MGAEEIWRAKTDDQVLYASQHLSDYTEEGRTVILAELQRRQDRGLTIESPAGAIDPPRDIEAAQSRGLLYRLWRGHVPLDQTYWLWGLGGRLASYFLMVMALFAGGLPAAKLVRIVAELYLIFITIAIWRSAGAYAGNRLWAELARVSIAAGLALSLASLLFD